MCVVQYLGNHCRTGANVINKIASINNGFDISLFFKLLHLLFVFVVCAYNTLLMYSLLIFLRVLL